MPRAAAAATAQCMFVFGWEAFTTNQKLLLIINGPDKLGDCLNVKGSFLHLAKLYFGEIFNSIDVFEGVKVEE